MNEKDQAAFAQKDGIRGQLNDEDSGLFKQLIERGKVEGRAEAPQERILSYCLAELCGNIS